jgi:hypothetical protein
MSDERPVVLGPGVPLDAADPTEDHRHDLRTLVTVSRQHPRDFGERQVYVRIDDGPQVSLPFGQTFTREVGPGAHRLAANNTLFWKNLSFSVESGEHVEFIVINYGGPLTLGIAGLLGAAPLYLKVIRRSIQ